MNSMCPFFLERERVYYMYLGRIVRRQLVNWPTNKKKEKRLWTKAIIKKIEEYMQVVEFGKTH